MKAVYGVEFHPGSKEERLPGFTADFPYIASYVEVNKFAGSIAPWHWHRTVELFYVESGEITYSTPKGQWIFPAGSGGMVNSNVLHMTRAQKEAKKAVQLIHIFEPSFIAGQQGSRIEQKYVMPVTTAPQIEMIALYPENPVQAKALKAVRESFILSEEEKGYELKLRSVLSDIWLQLFAIAEPLMNKEGDCSPTDNKVKQMMIYVHEHYGEKISIGELAASAFSSERECFRGFQECLHMTPAEYIKSYRLQMACNMLASGRETITFISQACGLGSSSYFGKVFREYFGCTPAQYRRKWQNNDR